MDHKFMKPGEDTKEIDKGIKNKWRWAWINEIGSDGNPNSVFSLAKKLAKDKIALTHLSLSRQYASYLITHGISPDFKKSLYEKLKNGIFSLNIDEATNIHNDRIMNILVQFYDEDAGSVKTQHLASRKVNIGNASALMLELRGVIQAFGLEWRQVSFLTIAPSWEGRRLDSGRRW